MASISKDGKGWRIQFQDANTHKRKSFRVGRLNQKQCQTICTHVEHIINAKASGTTIPLETAQWLGSLGDDFHAKLVAAGLTAARAAATAPPALPELAAFVDAYITQREATGAAERSVINYKGARDSLVDYFGESQAIDAITIADASAWRAWMLTGKDSRPAGERTKKPARRDGGKGGLDANTANRRCGFARQFFSEAVDARLIAENPFRKLKGIAVRANRERDFIVTPDIAAKVLAACPDAKWKLIFALARFGGLRCPCEYKPLAWGDVRWADNQIRIDSPKTGERFIPIFPELRPHLEAALAAAGDAAVDDPTTPIVDHPRGASWNFGTHMKRIIKKAGLTPWEKMFQNCRLTRQTELAAAYPIHLVCGWIGNSQAVALEHYLRATPADFAKASGVVQGVVQQASAGACTTVHSETASSKTPGNIAIPGVLSEQNYTPQESNL